MISFDLSSIPSDATIQSAEIELTHQPFSSSPWAYNGYPSTYNKSGTISAYRINKSWNESAITNAQSGWSSYNTSHVTTAEDVFNYSSSSTKANFDVKNAISDMVAGTVNNYGFMLITYAPSVHPYIGNSGTWTSWYSSEYSTTSMRPKLTIEYTGGSVTTYTLVVNSGNGDGDHAEGASVTITADAAPTGKEFDKWTGNVGYLADPNSSTTSITMPAQNIEVTATYKDIIADTYTLVVNSGNGDGDYAEGASTTITADAAPTGKVFDKWTGNVGYLADPNSSTTTVTMPAQDIEVTATYKDDGPIVKKDNYMVISSWEAVMDTLGSAIVIDSSKKADTILTAKITLGKSDEANENWAWAQITGYADGDFTAVTSVDLTYYSDNPVYISLDQEGLADAGASYQYLLPASSRGQVTIALSDFKQPSWVATDSPELVADLDMGKVLSISFAAINEESTVNLELLGIYLEGYKDNTPISSLKNIASNCFSIKTMSKSSLVLNRALSGMSTLSIYNVAGKKVFSAKKDLAKSKVVNFGNCLLTNGVYVVKIINENEVSVYSHIIR